MEALNLPLLSPARRVADRPQEAGANGTTPAGVRSGRTSAPPASARPARSEVFEQVGKTYVSFAGPVEALRDISLEIPAGSIFGIIGRRGAGKSSLLRTINRLEQPTTGRVLVGGVDIGALGAGELVALRRRIGMIF